MAVVEGADEDEDGGPEEREENEDGDLEEMKREEPEMARETVRGVVGEQEASSMGRVGAEVQDSSLARSPYDVDESHRNRRGNAPFLMSTRDFLGG